MIIKENLQKLFDNLIREDSGQIEVHGNPISVRVSPDSFKLSLSAIVYQGSNYIPKSVRNSLKENGLPLNSSIKTSLYLDESQFQVRLHYLGKKEPFDHPEFSQLLEEFSWIAEEWRYILDEHDRHDLVHVHVK